MANIVSGHENEANSERRGESSSESSSTQVSFGDPSVGVSMKGDETIFDDPNLPSVSTGSQAGSCEQSATTKSGAVHNEVTDVGKMYNEDEKAMNTLKEVLTNAKVGDSKDIRIIVLGKTGDGKSALINSIIDLKRAIAKESADVERCTDAVRLYRCSNIIPGVNVTVIDTPGLQDIHQQEQSYIQEMKSKCQEVTLILYCMKMTDRRLTNDDIVAMKKLHQAFGSKFWERVVFVLTFANKEDCDERIDIDEPEPDAEPPDDDEEAWAEIRKKRFTNRIKHRSKAMNAFLKDTFHISDVPFSVSGTYKSRRSNRKPMVLPDRKNWLADFLSRCCREIKEKHKFTKLSLIDKIHFAIIIDNYGKVREDTQENQQVNILKEALEGLGFCTLCFNNLNCESIFFLFEAFKRVDCSQLASFALLFLSKGNTNHPYDADSRYITFEQLFSFFKDGPSKIPKLFLFHLAYDGEPPSDQLAFPDPPNNSIALVVSIKQLKSTKVSHALSTIVNNLLPEGCHSKPLKQCFEEMKHQIEQLDTATCIYKNSLQDSFVMPTCPDSTHQLLEKKHRLCYVMWYPIRCKTIEVLLENKDEVMKIVQVLRVSNVGVSVAGIVGGALIGAGLLFAYPTVGISLSLSVVGSAIGGIGVCTSVLSFIASKVALNNRLNKAQFFVTFDRQFSSQLNTAAAKYVESLETFKKETLCSGMNAVTSAVGVARVVIEEGSELALRTASKVLVIVTIPVDILVLIYNFYLLHNAAQDKTGQTESNSTIQKLIEQFGESLKGFFHVIDTSEHSKSGQVINREYGYKVIIPELTLQKKPPVTVSTILSGPFNLPEGAVLVSAVYDILIDKSLKDPITIDIEHCVDVLDESVIGKMSFAIATADLTKKAFKVECIPGGSFTRGSAYGSITVKKSCLLCVLATEPLPCPELKYSINCSYAKFYQDFWTMKASFIKNLSAYSKLIQSDSIQNDDAIDIHTFHFEASAAPCINIQDFRTTASHDWTLSPHIIPDEPILKSSLDDIGLIHSGATLKGTIPFIEFHITRNEGSKKECDLELKLTGTDLNLPINCRD